MRSYQPDELDRLLDEALASYSTEEPKPGLEQRVRRRVRAEGTPGRIGWWRWAIAIPVFASLLLLAVTHRVRPEAVSVQRNHSSVEAPTAAFVAPVEPRRAAPRRVHRVVNRPVVARSSLPRRGVFPLPAPLSAQERALLDLVTRFPDQAREVLVEGRRNIEPIEIQKIEIPPLTGGSER